MTTHNKQLKSFPLVTGTAHLRRPLAGRYASTEDNA